MSISGVYGGMTDPLPMLEIFDKGLQIRMGQAHVKRWIDDLMPLVEDDADPLGVEDLATHLLPLAEAPHGYEIVPEEAGRRDQDGAAAMIRARSCGSRAARAGSAPRSARELARRGARVAITARTPPELEEVADSAAGEIVAVPGDVRDVDALKDAP